MFPDALAPRPPHSLLTFPSAETHVGTEAPAFGRESSCPQGLGGESLGPLNMALPSWLFVDIGRRLVSLKIKVLVIKLKNNIFGWRIFPIVCLLWCEVLGMEGLPHLSSSCSGCVCVCVCVCKTLETAQALVVHQSTPVRLWLNQQPNRRNHVTSFLVKELFAPALG